MNPTLNDLPEAARVKLGELLNARLADTIDLQTQLKYAHWNVKGPSFIALHELFDKLVDGVSEYADDLAERAVQLGGVAQGTVRQVAKTTQLPDYPAALSGKDHVTAVAKVLAAYAKSVRAAIDQASELRDQGTADLFTEISRGTDKSLWFVEAHLLG